MSDIKMLGEMWESYDQIVVPKEAGDAQRQDTRRAFYSGARAVMQVMEMATELLGEEQAMIVLDAIDAEVMQFVREVKEGKA